MTKTSKTVVFFGNECLATGTTTTAPTLRGLIANGYDVKAVVISQQATVSRKARKLPVVEVANEHGIPVLTPRKLSEISSELQNLNADIGVLVAFGQLVPMSVLDMFPHSIINIHPSLLPQYRGPTPIESVLLSGEAVTGVSIMKLAPAMDAGPVFAQKKLTLKGDETKQELCDTLLHLGSAKLLRILPEILDNQLSGDAQDESVASYCQKISKEDAKIDWQKASQRIAREIRAYAGWPGSRTMLGSVEVIVTECHTSNEQFEAEPGSLHATKTSLTVSCGEGALSISKVKPLGKQEMPIQSFLAGYGKYLA